MPLLADSRRYETLYSCGLNEILEWMEIKAFIDCHACNRANEHVIRVHPKPYGGTSYYHFGCSQCKVNGFDLAVARNIGVDLHYYSGSHSVWYGQEVLDVKSRWE